MNLSVGTDLPIYELIAYNYAPDSENQIHGDDIAKVYGFKGGLVPGVGDYAYMTHPIVETLGRDWLERGWMSAKFLKPVYDGDRVRVRTKVESIDPPVFDTELMNSEGTLCAVARAGILNEILSIDPHDYPLHPMPERMGRRSANIESLPAGTELGSLDRFVDLTDWGMTAGDRFADPAAAYAPDENAHLVAHPGILLQMANDILSENVDLGPWIHTASEIQNYAVPRDGEELTLRGRVSGACNRRGHEIVDLDLAMFGDDNRSIMKIKHSAIVRLRVPK